MKKSTNRFTKKRFTKGTKRWTGDNLTDEQYGFDSVDSAGRIFGSGDIGGQAHFRSRTGYGVNHKD